MFLLAVWFCLVFVFCLKGVLNRDILFSAILYTILAISEFVVFGDSELRFRQTLALGEAGSGFRIPFFLGLVGLAFT